MQSTHRDSTCRIYQTLKNIKLCSDGIRFANGTSIRLSNLQHFPNNLINNTSFLFKMVFLFSLATLDKAEAAISYFGSADKKQNYKVIIDGNNDIHMSAGDCNTVPVDHAVPYGYQLLKNWINPDQQAQTYNVQFCQGEGEPANNEIQNCGFDFIQQQINKIQAQVEADKAKRQAENEADLKILGIVLASMIGFVLLMALIAEIFKKIKKHSSTISASSLTNDQSISTYQSTENKNREPIITTDKQPIIENKKMECKITLAARLEKLPHFRVDSIPHDFICPVNKVIMTDPCLTNDGYSYEREVLEALQRNKAKCPMNKEEYVINIIPNHPLRSNIIAFVEEEERKDKLIKEEMIEIDKELTLSPSLK